MQEQLTALFRRMGIFLGAALLAPLLLACGSDSINPGPATDAGPAATTTTLPSSADTLPVLEQLRRGGYTIVIRHSLTDRSQGDDLDTILRTGIENDCSIQRNLNDSGREQARAMGVAIEKLALARRIVITSPYCRASETADLAFGAHQVNEVLSITPFTGRDTMEAAAVALRSFLTRLPPAGSNYVLITHSLNMVGVGLPDVGEGDSVVIRPDGSNWTVVAQIKADEWKDLR